MKKYLSIKYKLILILAITVIVTLTGYYLLATHLFEEDKIAYVYSTILNRVSSKENKFDIVLNQKSNEIDDYTQLLKLGNPESLRRILETKKDILYFSCSKNQFDFGSSVERDNLSQYMLDGLAINIEKRLIMIEKSSEGEHCLALYKADELFKDEEGMEGSLRFFIPIKKRDKPPEDAFTNEIRSKIITRKLHSGVKEIESNGTAFLVSFIKIKNNFYYVQAISKKEALASIEDLKEKSSYFFLALVSLVGVISIFIANKVSTPIMDLTEKVLLFGEGKFEVRSKVKSSDEFGQMAQGFNEMARKISNLVEEVRVYSTQLEGIVSQRTTALRKALGLQKAMINSLEQGFFMISNKLVVMNTYSKSAQKIFGNELEGMPVEKILKFKELDAETTKLLFTNMVSERLPFESMLGLVPKIIQTPEGRTIHLDFEPVRNKDNKILGIVVISSDKTEEVRLEQEAEIEKSKVAMILKIVSNQYAFTKLLEEVKGFLNQVTTGPAILLKSEAFLFAHTMKGCFLLFHMKKIVAKVHAIEEEIKSKSESENCYDLAIQLCDVIDIELNFAAQEHPFLFGGTNWRKAELTKRFIESDLVNLILEVKTLPAEAIEPFLVQKLIYVRFESLASSLKEDALLHAERVRKEISTFEIQGSEILVDPSHFSVHIQYLLHLTRNSIDHGIEFPDDRFSSGKLRGGKVVIELKDEDDFYMLSVSDDGKGLNESILRDKAISLGFSEDTYTPDKVYDLIFAEGFSTAASTSQTAGRGIGMSAIKNYIENLNGKILIDTEVGKFLKISLIIPKK
jgi:two-component system chemotaxis sensor kinase CheA